MTPCIIPTATDIGIALRMYVDHPPFDDIRVRRALHLAIDRQAMLQSLTDGKGAINPPGVPGNKTGWAIPPEELSKLPGYRQPKTDDLAEAKRLLAEAGYPSLKFRTLYSNEGSVAPLVIEPVIAQLRQIGVDVEADGRDTATFTKRDADGDFETALTYTAKMNIVQYVPRFFRSGEAFNKTGVRDPALDEAIDTLLTTFDEEVRKAAVRRMQEILLEKLYFIPLIETINYAVLQPWVRNFNLTDGSLLDISKASYIWLDHELLPPERR